MTKPKQLRERWKTAQGKQVLQLFSTALQQRKSIEHLKAIVAGLPYVEEVDSALDLRALPMDNIMQLFKVDLSGARLDYIEFLGNLVECKMVGTIFDNASAGNKLFSGDFAKASFVSAKLTGARFKTLRLTDADFSKARMMRAQLTQQKLQGSRFVNADLRAAELAGSDIRGADFSGADCSDATFGEVRFDTSTQLRDCKLSSGYMDPEFEAFAREQGAEIPGRSDQEGYREVDATIAVLKNRNRDHRYDGLLSGVQEIRDRAGRDPQWDWLGHLVGQLPNDQAKALQEAFEEGYRHMEHYLG